MIEFNERTADFVYTYFNWYERDKDKIIKEIDKCREEGETAEDVINLVECFYKDIPNSIGMALQYQIKQKNLEIDKLKQPLLCKALGSSEFDNDPSLVLIEKLEKSFIKIIENNHQLFHDEVENINGYGFHITPWFGYADFFIRGQELDRNHYYNIEMWEDYGYILLDREHTDLEWFADYIYETHKELHGNSIRLSAWDQWLRICVAIALTGHEFKNALTKFKFKTAENTISSFSHTFLIPPGDESALPEGFNYVHHVFAMKVQNQNKLDISAITNMYSWCIVPYKEE